MKIDQLHQEFLSGLHSAVEELGAKEQADALKGGSPAPGVSAAGMGAFDPILLIKYLPVVLDALSTLIKKFQTA